MPIAHDEEDNKEQAQQQNNSSGLGKYNLGK